MGCARETTLRTFRQELTSIDRNGVRLTILLPAVTRRWLFALFGSVQFWRGNLVLGRFILLDRILDFTTMNGYFLRSFDPQAYLVAANFNNNDGNVIIDDNTLVFLARQN